MKMIVATIQVATENPGNSCLTSVMDIAHYRSVIALFIIQMLKYLLEFFSFTRSVLVNNHFFLRLLLLCCSYANYIAQGAFVIIFSNNLLKF